MYRHGATKVNAVIGIWSDDYMSWSWINHKQTSWTSILTLSIDNGVASSSLMLFGEL